MSKKRFQQADARPSLEMEVAIREKAREVQVWVREVQVWVWTQR